MQKKDIIQLTKKHYLLLVKAKESYQGRELDAFKRTLKELAVLNINPVTIPREWHIDHIPNLLRSYLKQLLKSSFDLSLQNMETNYYTAIQYMNYYEKFGSPIQHPILFIKQLFKRSIRIKCCTFVVRYNGYATFIPAFLQKYKICNKLFAYTLIFATSFVCTNAYFRM